MIVLINPITKQPTAFAPVTDAPRYFEGPYQNVAEVTEEWQAQELDRVCALFAEQHPEWKRTR